MGRTAPPRTQGAHRAGLGSSHSSISKCTQGKKSRRETQFWYREEHPRQLLNPQHWNPQDTDSGEEESNPAAANEPGHNGKLLRMCR